MALTRIDLRGQSGPFDEVLPRPAEAGGDVRATVAEILDRVRTGGDAALRELTERFDGVRSSTIWRRGPAGEGVAAALGRMSRSTRAVGARAVAWSRVRAYHALESPAAAGLRRRTAGSGSVT